VSSRSTTAPSIKVQTRSDACAVSAGKANVRFCRRPGDRASRPCVRSASSCQQGELDLWVAVQPHAKLIADWASSGFRMVLLSVAVVWGIVDPSQITT
jgi:hypothetical protein